MMDHLSKVLQSTKMPAIKGKKCANLLIDILRSMKSDKKKIVKKADDPISPAGKPTLQRKRKKQNYSILQYATGYEGPESNPYHPKTDDDYFKSIHFQALDTTDCTMINLHSLH